MGDTFGRVMTDRNVNAVKAKLSLMNDLAGVIDSKEIFSLQEVLQRIDREEAQGKYEDDDGLYSDLLEEFVEIAAALLGRRVKASDEFKEIYLFVAQPTDVNQNDDEDGWDGSIKRLSAIIDAKNVQLNKEIKEHVVKAVGMNASMIGKMSDELKAQITQLREDITPDSTKTPAQSSPAKAKNIQNRQEDFMVQNQSKQAQAQAQKLKHDEALERDLIRASMDRSDMSVSEAKDVQTGEKFASKKTLRKKK